MSGRRQSRERRHDVPAGCEGVDRPIAELLVEGLAGEDEQAVVPGGHEHGWSRHDGILSATNCDDGSHDTARGALVALCLCGRARRWSHRIRSFMRSMTVCWSAHSCGRADFGSSPAQPAYEQLRIVAPAAPGGGWDQTARVMQQVLQQTGSSARRPVENVPGAAGTIGLARFIGAEHGRGDAVMVSGLIMLGAIVTHRSPVTLRDVTPIARLTGEYEVIVVPAASPFRSLRRPDRARCASGRSRSPGAADRRAAAIRSWPASSRTRPVCRPRRVNYIAFSGGGESLSAIVGGQVSVGVNGLAELAAQIEAGAVRALAISSAERLPGLDVPTLREQGDRRRVRELAVRGRAAGHRRRPIVSASSSSSARMVRSPQWRDALDRYRWLDRYLAGDAFARYVDDEEARVRRILRELGTGGDETRAWSSRRTVPAVRPRRSLARSPPSSRRVATRRRVAARDGAALRPAVGARHVGCSIGLIGSPLAAFLGLAARRVRRSPPPCCSG